jgi:hypothetical protein
MSNLDEQPFPRAPLIAAILVVGLTVAGVGATRLGLISPGVAEASDATPVTAADMRFADMEDGGVLVTVIDDATAAPRAWAPNSPSASPSGRTAR